MIQKVIEHKAEILFVLLSMSECLALIPAVKSNSIFQLVVNGIKKLSEKFPAGKEEPKSEEPKQD